MKKTMKELAINFVAGLCGVVLGLCLLAMVSGLVRLGWWALCLGWHVAGWWASKVGGGK